MVRQVLNKISNCRPLLANSNVDAVQFILIIVTVKGVFLVDDGVYSNGSLSGLSITDN